MDYPASMIIQRFIKPLITEMADSPAKNCAKNRQVFASQSHKEILTKLLISFKAM